MKKVKQDTKFETIELEGSFQDPKWKKAVEKSLRRDRKSTRLNSSH